MQGYTVFESNLYIGMAVTQQTLAVTSAVKGQSSTFIVAMDQERGPWNSRSQVLTCLDIVGLLTCCGGWKRQRHKTQLLAYLKADMVYKTNVFSLIVPMESSPRAGYSWSHGYHLGLCFNIKQVHYVTIVLIDLIIRVTN
jgi:hypothetical protein